MTPVCVQVQEGADRALDLGAAHPPLPPRLWLRHHGQPLPQDRQGQQNSL